MGIPKNITVNENLEVDDDVLSSSEHIERKNKTWQSKRGAKKSTSAIPKGAIRVTTDAKIKTNRPKLVYKERIVSPEDGSEHWMIWVLSEQSQYKGIEELVEFNPRTEAEVHKGYDYLIPFTPETAKKIIQESFGETKFYIKDGVPTYRIKREDLDELFLKNYVPGITPTPKIK